jgi:uncharacterized protein
MRRDDVIRTLRQHRDELTHQYGVKSLALFGSVARDEAAEASDVDLLVEFDDRPVGLFHLARTYRYVKELLGVRHLDLVLRRALFEELRPSILKDAIDVVG